MLSVDLHSLIETNERPFVVIDGSYQIVAANAAYCRQYGMERAEVLRRRCHEVSHHSPRPCHENGELCPHLALFASGESCEVLHTHYDGEGHAARARIKGHAIHGSDGRLYLGEVVYPLEAELPLACADMRMVGHSPAFLSCIDNLARAAESEASILLYGESGVGKELAARFLHERSPRAGKPFIAINCAAVPEAMFENELFGHERGAFTGSTAQKKGLYELADGGTLFLDEVAEIPLTQQAKLLRVLETGEFRRVGGTVTLRADVRVVSATNRNLLDWVDQDRFREDLYYRIAGIDLSLPALRERREDIPALAEVLLVRLAGNGHAHCHLDKAAIQLLKNYAFPGNVRELRNVLQRALLRCRNGVIGAEDIVFQQGAPVSLPQAPRAKRSDPSLKGAEKEYIRDLLERHEGHRKTVADLLGVSERTLYRKLDRYGLK
ncbi:MAG: sigma 54-interacting transcriptional regulator [Gallionellaceae bacterium]|nr:sigma 54-interacting transcriptional regulator [Gallionellaceae bacterium]